MLGNDQCHRLVSRHTEASGRVRSNHGATGPSLQTARQERQVGSGRNEPDITTGRGLAVRQDHDYGDGFGGLERGNRTSQTPSRVT